MDVISNIPATLEWRVYKGDTARFSILLEDDKGVAIDTTGYNFAGQIKTEPGVIDALQDLLITVSDNLLTVDITDSQSLPRMSYFDIQVTKEDLSVLTILKGYIYSEDDVTE